MWKIVFHFFFIPVVRHTVVEAVLAQTHSLSSIGTIEEIREEQYGASSGL